MLAIQPKESGGGGGESRESVVSRQASEMLSKLPRNYDPFEVKERYHPTIFFLWCFKFLNFSSLRAMNLLNPLNIFLRQEIDRMQKVISLVRQTLTDLLLAIEGTIIMSEVSLLITC